MMFVKIHRQLSKLFNQTISENLVFKTIESLDHPSGRIHFNRGSIICGNIIFFRIILFCALAGWITVVNHHERKRRVMLFRRRLSYLGCCSGNIPPSTVSGLGWCKTGGYCRVNTGPDLALCSRLAVPSVLDSKLGYGGDEGKKLFMNSRPRLKASPVFYWAEFVVMIAQRRGMLQEAKASAYPEHSPEGVCRQRDSTKYANLQRLPLQCEYVDDDFSRRSFSPYGSNGTLEMFSYFANKLQRLRFGTFRSFWYVMDSFS